ncbi:hypothetical protein [Streptomyces sp. NPDC016845]|uniref:hypothetical protein n=1 Tax=Streptomyces sp. NPDC016845 TaxID=3364972 RepID=UPI0037A1D9BA
MMGDGRSGDAESERTDVVMRAIVRRAVADLQEVMAVDVHFLGDGYESKALLVTVPVQGTLFVCSAPIGWEALSMVHEMDALSAIGHVSMLVEARAAQLATDLADFAWARVASELSKVRELLQHLEGGDSGG